MINWHEKSKEDVLKELDSNMNNGLSSETVEKIQQKYGKNEFAEPPIESIFAMIVRHMKDLATIILLIAALISLVMVVFYGDDILKFLVITGIIVLNLTLAITQERGAEKSLAALKKLSSPTNIVLRGGMRQEIPSTELVVGDIIFLKTGDMISADARLLESTDLMVDEAALTGESIASEKDANLILGEQTVVGDQKNMVFAGCLVVAGHAKAIVVATAMNTQVGIIAGYLNTTTKLLTPLQIRIYKLGKVISIVAILSALSLLVSGIIRGWDIWELALLSVALCVAAVPETLPLIVTLTLAHGVKEMVKKHALIRKLQAVETLGSTSVICSDKTGTLTQNRMAVKKLWIDGSDPFSDEADFSDKQLDLLSKFALATNAVIESNSAGETVVMGSPTESAIINLLIAKGINRVDAEKAYPRVEEIAFSSERKMATFIQQDAQNGGYRVLTLGAYDRVPFKNSSTARDQMHDNFAENALRILALGSKHITELPSQLADVERELEFEGIIGLIDPPRPEAITSVAIAKAAGVKTVMITGDHAITAKAIAKQVGILNEGDKVITGVELSKLSQEDLEAAVKEYSVYARVSPEDKIRIVKAWQSHNEVVAMTGDGVNDAPALKRADVGVAMGITGTEVSKSASDMVLTDDNFASIVDAIRYGRNVFANIQKTVYFLLTCNFSEIILILGSGIMGWGIPLTPIMILYINVIADGVPGMALALEKPAPEIMQRNPVGRKESIFNGYKFVITMQVISFTLVGWVAYYIGVFVGLDKHIMPSHELGQTMAFIVIGWTSIWHIFTVRSRSSIANSNIGDNPLLAYLALLMTASFVIIEVIPQVGRIFDLVPMGLNHWFIAIGLSIVPTIIAEIHKFFTRVKA
ncbi:MAG: cation-translocating P-type ATPase [Alphaproteobacteria bacterium]|jgi:calcium-translocating P-type ATPase|nr:cation-translocating P-type ATPase [Alphaproteobacteria bacterium]